MKRHIATILFMLINILFLNGQQTITKPEESKIGLYFSPYGDNNIFRSKGLIEAPTYEVNKSFSVGLNHIDDINNWLKTETGIEYSQHEIITYTNRPHEENNYQTSNLSIISLPVSLQAVFLKYIFINSGIFMGFDFSTNASIDSQTGIGALFGLGVKYDSNFKISLFLNPYAKTYSLIPFTTNRSQQHIRESGVRFGLAYTL